MPATGIRLRPESAESMANYLCWASKSRLELELLSQPPRGSINRLKQVRNSVLMLNRTIVFPRDLQRRQ